MSWVLAILGFVALIVLHELGHFLTAKAVGMRVERFSLFFPPKLVGFRRGETEYSIGAIPAGGYVKITGMHPEELRDMDLRVAARAYYLQDPWRRIAVILAGPGVNLLIAFLLFWALLFAGNLNGASTLERLNPSVRTLAPTTAVAAVQRGAPAYGALALGDRLLAVDGQHVTVPAAIRAISAHHCAGVPRQGCRALTPVQLTVRRAARVLHLSVYPRYDATLHRMMIGFGFGATPKRFGVLGAAGASLGEMWGITSQTLTNIGRAFTSPKVRHQFSSIVGITVDTQEAVTAGAGYALVILGFISLVLAVMNLFPFLPLDGGHVVWSVAEKLRGRRVSLAAMWRFSSIGIVLLAFLVLNGVSNDISRLGG